MKQGILQGTPFLKKALHLLGLAQKVRQTLDALTLGA